MSYSVLQNIHSLIPTGSVEILLGLSLFGALGLSVLWPLIALPAYWMRRKFAPHKAVSPCISPTFIEIIIPAHNESRTLAATLTSLQHSLRHLQKGNARIPAPPQVRIHVGADTCTDPTTSIARKFPGVHVTEFSNTRSKWVTLKTLCTRSTADWIILVDAGTLWPENFLSDVVHRMAERPQAVAICPAYRPLHGGLLNRSLWKIEALLKRLEVFCGGGPVSVHGATVCYQAAPLKRALNELGGTRWLNDDVAIPLILRALYPDDLIVYPVSEIQDTGVRYDVRGTARRARILTGNLQWVVALLPFCFRRNPVAGVVALRRLFRILWAYWAVFTVLACAFVFPILLPFLLILFVGFMSFASSRELVGAAWVSLQTPFRLIRHDVSLEGAWK
jgi:hypothetical protein